MDPVRFRGLLFTMFYFNEGICDWYFSLFGGSCDPTQLDTFVNFAFSDALDLGIQTCLKLLLKQNFGLIKTGFALFPWFILYAEHQVNPHLHYTGG